MALINSETILAARAELAKRELQRRSLYEFFRSSWHVLEPGSELKLNWHLSLLAEYLELVSTGEIKRLLINIAPRHLKSTLCSICFPVWEWMSEPSYRYLFLSYSARLSTKHSLKRRTLIQSPWFQAKWGDKFFLSGDHNLKTEQENNFRGQMFSTSMGGTVMGEGGDRIICLPYNVLISTNQGKIEIGEIVEKQLDILVTTFNHDEKTIEFVAIDQYEQNGNKEIIEIDLGDRVLRCTEDHPVWVEGKGYIKAGLIEPGDEVMVDD